MASISPSDVQILFLDMQPMIVCSVQTVSHANLRKTAAAATRVGEALGVPITASAVRLGEEAPSLIDELGSLEPQMRATVSPFHDAALAARLKANDRRTLAIAGVSSEIAILNAALDARRSGYDVHVLLDCCGGLNDRAEAAALRQMERAGAIPSSVLSLFTCMIDDMTVEPGRSVMGALAALWS